MSRRVLMPNAGTIDRRASRMAPGGRVASESRIEQHYPMIGDAGEEPPPPEIVWFDSPAQYTVSKPPSGYGYTSQGDSDIAVGYGPAGPNWGAPPPSIGKTVWMDPLGPKREYDLGSDAYGPWNPGFVRFIRDIRAHTPTAPPYYDLMDARSVEYACVTYRYDQLVTRPYEPWNAWTAAGETGGWEYLLPGGGTYQVHPNDENFDWDAYDAWQKGVGGSYCTITSATMDFSGSFVVPYPINDPGGQSVPTYQLVHFPNTVPVFSHPTYRIPPSFAPGMAGEVFGSCELYSGLNITVNATAYAAPRASFTIGGYVNWQDTGTYWHANAGVRFQANAFTNFYTAWQSSLKWRLIP